MRGFLKPLVHITEVAALEVVNKDEEQLHNDFQLLLPNLATDLEFVTYLSDIEFEDDGVEDEEEPEEETESKGPQRKWQKVLEVLAQEELWIAHENLMAEFKKGLDDLKKHIKSWKTLFGAGNNGLQATGARAIKSYMHLVVQKGHKKFEASEMLALIASFVARTGSQLIRLPTLDRGQHIKVKSLLKDPSICAEMWTYLCSHKWATNLKKFANFTEQKLSQLKQKKNALWSQEISWGWVVPADSNEGQKGHFN